MDLLNPPRLDKRAIIKFFDNAAKSYDNAAILHEEVSSRLLDRLQYMRHQPETIVDLGCGTGKVAAQPANGLSARARACRRYCAPDAVASRIELSLA